MSFLVSPGVRVREIDLTNVVPAVSTSIGAIAGAFKKGPVSQIVTVTSEQELVSIFGEPVADDNQFDVITSGVRPPDAPRLLGSERFKDFIDILNAKNIYDLIIIDNTPVGGLSDPLLVSEKMDGLIVTVSLNNVSKPVVNETFKRIDTNSNKVNLLGVVANQRKYIKKFDKKYGYGYGYQYNYLYEQYAQDPREKQKDNLEDIILLPNFLKDNQYLQKLYKKLKLFLNWVDN